MGKKRRDWKSLTNFCGFYSTGRWPINYIFQLGFLQFNVFFFENEFEVLIDHRKIKTLVIVRPHMMFQPAHIYILDITVNQLKR